MAFQHRDDYKEWLQLSIIFSGDENVEDFNIYTPGVFYRAGWMSKLIYSMKIYLFRSQFKLTAICISSLQLFLLHVYIKYY